MIWPKDICEKNLGKIVSFRGREYGTVQAFLDDGLVLVKFTCGEPGDDKKNIVCEVRDLTFLGESTDEGIFQKLANFLHKHFKKKTLTEACTCLHCRR